MKRTFSILIFFFALLFSCTSKEEEKLSNTSSSKVTNPNGMSEMSLIMEDWYTEMEKMAQELKRGHMVKEMREFEEQKVLSAKTTKTNIRKEHFSEFTHSFFYNYSQISKAGSLAEQKSEFNLTVKSCLNCHEQYCHGPMVRIKKLTLNVE